jgi:CHASE3 domain sensor protein
MIRERLNALGLSQEEIQARLNQMSNDQVHQLAVNLDEMKVAGDDAVTVLIVLVIVAIAILLVYLMGYRLILKKG